VQLGMIVKINYLKQYLFDPDKATLTIYKIQNITRSFKSK